MTQTVYYMDIRRLDEPKEFEGKLYYWEVYGEYRPMSKELERLGLPNREIYDYAFNEGQALAKLHTHYEERIKLHEVAKQIRDYTPNQGE